MSVATINSFPLSSEEELRAKLMTLLRTPSMRDHEIFDAVKLDHRSLRNVAAQFQLSHSSVAVIVRNFEKWVGQTIGVLAIGCNAKGWPHRPGELPRRKIHECRQNAHDSR